MLRTTAGLFPVTAYDGAVGTDGTMDVHSTVSPLTTPYYRHVVGTDPVPADAVCVMFAGRAVYRDRESPRSSQRDAVLGARL
jgi:hypothetical protein